MPSKNVLLVGAGALAVLALMVFHNVRIGQAKAEGEQQGKRAERLVWTQRESKELAEANAKITELQEKYRALEKKSAADVAAAAANHKKEITRVETEKHRALADAESFRLRWTTTCPAGQSGDRGRAASTGSASGGGVATTTCELPDQVRKDLIELASDADKVVIERNAILEIAKKDREVCK
jgi:HK97 family phage major capsid protein